MINFHDTSAVDWLLPALMVATWLVLWAVRRGVGGRFFAIAIGLVVLCLPLGLAVSTLGANCPRPVPPGCMSTYTWVLFMNGFLGLYCWVVLLIVTLLVQLAQFLARHARRDPVASEPAERQH